MSNDGLIEVVREAKKASLWLAQVRRLIKDDALRAAAREILLRKEEILKANMIDVANAEELKGKSKITPAILNRLKLDQYKIAEMAKMIEEVADLDDPVGKPLSALKMDEGMELFKTTVPFGVIASIFESRPDALPQIAALCIKSGNVVLLKGGAEAQESNRILFKIMRQAIVSKGIPEGVMWLIEGRQVIADLVKMEGLVDLIIPRGSNEFVRFIQDNTRIPVLGHSEGICHIYVDAAFPKRTTEIIVDARVQYPAACNSMKVLLLDSRIESKMVVYIASKLVDNGVVIKGCPKTVEMLRAQKIPVMEANESDWSTEYLDLVLPVRIVNGVDEAIAHINTFGSKHTDAILTEDKRVAKHFLRMVDSSSVMLNASTRFADGYRYGLGAEVGISTNKIHARGPVGLEGLVTTKFVLLGTGQKVSEYLGRGAKAFVHKRIIGNWESRME
jgi:glutamate-5-semialdehyde dehydrogenase